MLENGRSVDLFLDNKLADIEKATADWQFNLSIRLFRFQSLEFTDWFEQLNNQVEKQLQMPSIGEGCRLVEKRFNQKINSILNFNRNSIASWPTLRVVILGSVYSVYAPVFAGVGDAFGLVDALSKFEQSSKQLLQLQFRWFSKASMRVWSIMNRRPFLSPAMAIERSLWESGKRVASFIFFFEN